MAAFTVNGKPVTVEQNQKLIRYLRDSLGLTSVKDGCSEGACGTCTVLIDGRPTRACIPQTDKLEGKSVLTVEGLTDFEKRVYTYAFGQAGAVQCGFCIPGMVMCAKALLDGNPTPFCWRRSCSGPERCLRFPPTGPWGPGCPGWTWRRRSPERAFIPTTCTWTACCTPPPSAPPIPGPGSWRFTPRRPRPCPA